MLKGVRRSEKMNKNKLDILYQELSLLLTKQRNLKNTIISLVTSIPIITTSHTMSLSSNLETMIEYHNLLANIRRIMHKIKEIEKQENVNVAQDKVENIKNYGNMEEKIPYIELLYGQEKNIFKR